MRHTRFSRLAPILLVVLLMLSFASVAMAQPAEPQGPDIPNLPHWFYGTVATDKGKSLPAGTGVSAKAATGSWLGEAQTTVDGVSRYGWEPNLFWVPAYDSGVPGSGARAGDQIAFYVMGVRARLYNVDTGVWSDTYTFKYGEHTNLNLAAPLYYTITATAGPGCTIDPSGEVEVAYGFDQAFTIAASPGYKISDVTVDGVSQGPLSDYTFTNVTDDHEIVATCSTFRLYHPFMAK